MCHVVGLVGVLIPKALLVAIVLMMVSSLVRGTDPQTLWALLPSQASAGDRSDGCQLELPWSC